jgi:hypothetical protein
MALLHADGFDAAATADLALDYDVGGTPAIGAYGRFGTQGLRATNTQSIGVTKPANSNFVMGFALYVDADGISVATPISNVLDANNGWCHLILYVNADRSFSVVRGAGGGGALSTGFGATLGTSAVNKATVRSWMTVEWKAVIHDTTGSVTLKVNGETLFSVSGVDTSNSSTAITKYYIGSGAGHTVQIDDWWICDQSGTRLNDFLGDRVVESQAAEAGNGAHAEWTPSSGSDHGAMVDDATSDGDTTYNAANTVGLRDTYTFPALARVASVDAVQVRAVLRKDASGTRAVTGLTRVGTTDVSDATEHFLSEGYAGYLIADLPENPDTTAPWVIADVDTTEVGVEVTV